MDKELKYLVDNEIIDLPNIQSLIEMKKRKELLEKHPYKIWEGTNGKWYTYLPDEKKGRILKKRNTKKDLVTTSLKYSNISSVSKYLNIGSNTFCFCSTVNDIFILFFPIHLS